MLKTCTNNNTNRTRYILKLIGGLSSFTRARGTTKRSKTGIRTKTDTDSSFPYIRDYCINPIDSVFNKYLGMMRNGNLGARIGNRKNRLHKL